jgi:hypothetical protein
MEHSSLNTASVPELRGLSRWQRLRHRLRAIAFHKREDDLTVNDAGGKQLLEARAAGTNGGGNGQVDTDATVRGMLISRWRDTANEAGRPEGRVVPALVLGEQRYPDPSVWGPKTKTPLMQDEEYREALAFLTRLEERRKLRRERD